MNIPYIINPLWWFSVFMPKPVEEKKEAPKWEMDFYETYQTRVTSGKKTRKEAEEECFRLFNIHIVKPVRVKLDADIREV